MGDGNYTWLVAEVKMKGLLFILLHCFEGSPFAKMQSSCCP